MMKLAIGVVTAMFGLVVFAPAEVSIDEHLFGESLGGWKKKTKQYAQYVISGTKYRTYRPEWTVTPDGGTYASVRIDNVRGWFSSDDHAVLEITVNRRGEIISAQSNIAIQGRSISSDVIQGVGNAGNKVASIDRAVQIGTDLVASLSSKLLRAKMVEPGRVSFPSAVRHNYNLLYRSIRVDGKAVSAVAAAVSKPLTSSAKPVAPPDKITVSHAVPLKIRNYDGVVRAEDPGEKSQ